MKHTFQWFQSSIVAFFIISVFDPLQASDAYLNPSLLARKNLYNYLVTNAKFSNIRSNRNPHFSNYIQSKYFLSRPVRRIGSEFLGKRSLALFPIKIDEKENEIKENHNFAAFKDKHLYNINENENENENVKYSQQTRNKRGVNSYDNRKLKSLFSFLMKNREDYFGKRFGYYSKVKPYVPYGYNRDIVGSEFLGKRSPYSSESGMRKIDEGKEGIEKNDDNDLIFHNKEEMKLPDSSNLPSKESNSNDDVEEEKRALGSEFLGKRVLGPEFSGKRALGSEFLGKRALGSEFLGKRALGSEFLGKRALGSEFLGKRALGSEFLGKRALGSEFLGKRALGSEFLGKRAPDEASNLQTLEGNNLNKETPDDSLGKRALGSEFLGKRHEGFAILLKGNNEQGPSWREHQNFEHLPQNTSFNKYQSLEPGNYSQSSKYLSSSEIPDGGSKYLNSNNIYPLYNFNTPSKYYSNQS